MVCGKKFKHKTAFCHMHFNISKFAVRVSKLNDNLCSWWWFKRHKIPYTVLRIGLFSKSRKLQHKNALVWVIYTKTKIAVIFIELYLNPKLDEYLLIISWERAIAGTGKMQHSSATFWAIDTKMLTYIVHITISLNLDFDENADALIPEKKLFRIS